MKSKNVFFSYAILIIFLFTALISTAQNTKQTIKSTSASKVELIQFHSEHRCMTCNKIEALSRETLKSFPSIPFSLVNVDDAKNEKKAAQFEAAGTALFLYNPKTGKKKDLTEFAFMNASEKDEFITGLKKEINLFLKSK
jgi:phosphoribosylanthranilate isomerase